MTAMMRTAGRAARTRPGSWPLTPPSCRRVKLVLPREVASFALQRQSDEMADASRNRRSWTARP